MTTTDQMQSVVDANERVVAAWSMAERNNSVATRVNAVAVSRWAERSRSDWDRARKASAWSRD